VPIGTSGTTGQDGETVNFGGHGPVASFLITGGGRFPHILDLFQGLVVGVPSGCLVGNLDF